MSSMMSSFLVLITGVALSFVSHQDIQAVMDQDPTLIVPSEIKHFTFGFQESIADSLWLKVLQHPDFCENKDAPKASNTSKGVENILNAQLPPSKCHLGWLFQAFNTITDIAPRFDYAYQVGGVLLSVGADDREGARIIFDKGLKQFPDDWILNYYASYHYLYEIQDGDRASDLMLRAAKSPEAPFFLVALAAKLKGVEGQAALGISILEEYLHNNPEGPGAERAKIRLKELRAQLESEKIKN